MYQFSQICFPDDHDKCLIGFRVAEEGSQKYQEDGLRTTVNVSCSALWFLYVN